MKGFGPVTERVTGWKSQESDKSVLVTNAHRPTSSSVSQRLMSSVDWFNLSNSPCLHTTHRRQGGGKEARIGERKMKRKEKREDREQKESVVELHEMCL